MSRPYARKIMEALGLPELLTFDHLKEKLGIPWGWTQLWRMEKPEEYDDPFPERLHLGRSKTSKVVWNAVAVIEWLLRRGFDPLIGGAS